MLETIDPARENAKCMAVKPRIVVSGVNLVEAGPLSIYQDALTELSRNYLSAYEVIAFVHRKDLFDLPGINFIEYPDIKASWLRRIKFEYHDLYAISRELDADLWLSLHDMSPHIHVKAQAVYCHNAAPFAELRFFDLIHDWRYSTFALLYRYLYRINIHRNRYVIVQQSWMRDRFRQMYGLKNIIVARPESTRLPADGRTMNTEAPFRSKPFRFFYPAYPRVFKNIEILLDAAKLLRDDAIEIWLTFSGQESGYAKKLVARGHKLPNIRFLGRLTRAEVYQRYEAADCLLFPSRLETWGLPISEFRNTGKPMLVADLPYSHETVGTYRSVNFFNPDDASELASLMKGLAEGSMPIGSAVADAIPEPFAAGWHDLFEMLLRPVR